MTRINNPKCEHCNMDCVQCPMPFYERSGYPKSIFLMLKTKRITTGLSVARGLVEIPMPNPQLMQEYWKLKDENVAKLKRKEENAWQQMKEIAVKIYNLKKDELIFKKKKGGWRAASKNQITIAIYDVIGMRYLTNQARELVEEQIKGLLENYVAEKEANANDEENEQETEEEGENGQGDTE